MRPISGILNVVNSPAVVTQQSDIYKFTSPDRPVIFNSSKQAISSSGDFDSSPKISNQYVQPQYKRLTATKFLSELNASSGSMLVFAETFDNGWKAYINGTKVDSVPVNGMINGFPLNTDGKVFVSIEYEPQKWFEIGAIIAIVYTVSFITVGLLRKHISQRISALTNIIRSR